jgi:hypothetical protein
MPERRRAHREPRQRHCEPGACAAWLRRQFFFREPRFSDPGSRFSSPSPGAPSPVCRLRSPCSGGSTAASERRQPRRQPGSRSRGSRSLIREPGHRDRRPESRSRGSERNFAGPVRGKHGAVMALRAALPRQPGRARGLVATGRLQARTCARAPAKLFIWSIVAIVTRRWVGSAGKRRPTSAAAVTALRPLADRRRTWLLSRSACSPGSGGAPQQPSRLVVGMGKVRPGRRSQSSQEMLRQ